VAAPFTDPRSHPHLLERLVEVVRPEFRGEVFHPPHGSAVFFAGECVVASCPTMVSHTERGLCEGHYQRWNISERLTPSLGFEAWLIAEDTATTDRNAPPPACAVSGRRGCSPAPRPTWTAPARPARRGGRASSAAG
jgi:hypothetical protein